MSPLTNLATIFKTAKFCAHRAHHFITGPSFFSDHEYLGSLYGTYDDAFDTLVERSIGLGDPIDETKVVLDAAAEFKGLQATKPPEAVFRLMLSLEKDICREILQLKGLSPGTTNLVQGMADESEARQYKLKQRTA